MMGGRYNADALESRMVNPCKYAGLDAGFSLAENVPKDRFASHLSTPRTKDFASLVLDAESRIKGAQDLLVHGRPHSPVKPLPV